MGSLEDSKTNLYTWIMVKHREYFGSEYPCAFKINSGQLYNQQPRLDFKNHKEKGSRDPGTFYLWICRHMTLDPASQWHK